MAASLLPTDVMNIHESRTPVLIGIGQVVSRWNGESADGAPSPNGLRLEAASAALDDVSAREAVAASIDTVMVVRTILDSMNGTKHPFGRSNNPPGALAHALGITPRRAIYSIVGGDQPQALVNEAAEAIFAGAANTVLLAGAEATAAMKTALRKRIALDWSDSASTPLEDRGLGPPMRSDYEIANGLGVPTHTYPLFEQALRARLGLDRDQHRELMSQLWARFSRVAAGNPFAQYPEERSIEFLSTPSADNYAVTDPYLKWDVAQDAVNQGAALLMTSVGRACEMGVDPAKFVYLHGYAQVADRPVTARPDLSRSRAMELALAHALAAAGKKAEEIAHFDLYSCFPCAVLLAAEALGLDWRTTSATVTGGLPFFGGAGNNYSMHAIATMVERMRTLPTDFGLVLANGGYLSKEAVGIYSAMPKENWQPVSSATLAQAMATPEAPHLLSESTTGVIESYSVTMRKGQPQRGNVIVRTEKGRVLARARSDHRTTLAALNRIEPIGRTVRITHRNGINYIEPSDRVGMASHESFLARHFHFVKVERRGHVLEVTLNRPESMNALHSPAHFELHEIWDEFEDDSDLWVGIVTGAGGRAFCSGNDLKATAKGADMSLPASGFGGLCSRFDREKPVIAAINGVAMGGGMEIMLACDLAVAAHDAKFALPEVKVGLYAAAGGVQRLTRQIGRKAAMEMILTGRHIGADEALSLGIVNQVVPAGDALDAARALANTLLRNSPSAIRASRQALNRLEEIESLHEAMKANGPIFGRLIRTNDFREGVTAFAEKRQPNWSNN